jgi:hypothetical protein
MHPCIHASMHPCIHASMHACMHTYTHTDTQTHRHTYTHTHIHCIHVYCNFFCRVSRIRHIQWLNEMVCGFTSCITTRLLSTLYFLGVAEEIGSCLGVFDHHYQIVRCLLQTTAGLMGYIKGCFTF